MSKKGWRAGSALLGLGLAVCAVVYGPSLWSGYRFMQALDERDLQHQAKGAPWPQLQETCSLCHGADGQSRNAQYPALAGLPEAYLQAQLQVFAQGRRSSAPMQALAASLSQEQIERLAAYFARQKPVPTQEVQAEPERFEQGRQRVAALGCVACHGAQLSGGTLGPRIAGQGQVYLSDQLMAFKQGRRQDPTQGMNALAAGLSEQDVHAISLYLARLEPAALR